MEGFWYWQEEEESYLEEVERFEASLQSYSRMHGEELPDSLLQALLKMNAPDSIRTQVELQEYATAEELRDALKRFAQSRVQHSQPPGLAPLPGEGGAAGGQQDMDVGAIGKGGKGGKGGKNDVQLLDVRYSCKAYPVH